MRIGSFSHMTYKEFLTSKIEIAKDSGFEISDSEINPALKPHQRDAVRWALKGGRRALFESFGLGKTVQELEYFFLPDTVSFYAGWDLFVFR